MFGLNPLPGTIADHDLGLSGRIAITSCLIEPYRNQPPVIEVFNCKAKLFAFFAKLQRQADGLWPTGGYRIKFKKEHRQKFLEEMVMVHPTAFLFIRQNIHTYPPIVQQLSSTRTIVR